MRVDDMRAVDPQELARQFSFERVQRRRMQHLITAGQVQLDIIARPAGAGDLRRFDLLHSAIAANGDRGGFCLLPLFQRLFKLVAAVEAVKLVIPMCHHPHKQEVVMEDQFL